MGKIAIINNAEPGIKEFTVPVENIVFETDFEPVCLEYRDSLTSEMSIFDGIIMTGSPQGDDIVEHHAAYFSWIKNFNKPVFGICAGHHITGYVFGSELLRSIEPESGIQMVKIVKEDLLFKGMPHIFKVKQMHNDSITLPDEFELLVTSEICKNQVMKHKKKPIYTCQFHPEFYNQDLMKNFLEICKK